MPSRPVVGGARYTAARENAGAHVPTGHSGHCVFVVLGWDTVRRVFQIVVFEAVSELVLAAGRRRIRTTGNPLCRVIHTFSNPGFTDSIMWIGFALVLGVAAES